MPEHAPVHILIADLDNPIHACGIVDCLDSYARDAMGGQKGLPDEIRQLIIPGLKQHGANVTWIAQLGGEVVGVAVCIVSFSTFYAKPRLNLHDLAVNPAQRGRGIGRKLLEAVVEYARISAYCAVSLEVRHDNPRAQALYRSLGFSGGQHPMAFWIKPL